MGVAVDRRDDVRAEGGRGEVDEGAAQRPQDLLVVAVGAGRGRVEDDVDIGELVQGDQSFDALVGRGDLEAAGTGQAVGVRVDAGQRGDLQGLGQA